MVSEAHLPKKFVLNTQRRSCASCACGIPFVLNIICQVWPGPYLTYPLFKNFPPIDDSIVTPKRAEADIGGR